jgi:hypothetical protein
VVTASLQSALAELLDELGSTVKLPGAACRGRWRIFDSSDPQNIAAAQRICAGCPALDRCRSWAATQQQLTGVVAGVVQQRRTPRDRQSTAPVAPVSGMRRRAMEALASLAKSQ